MNGSCSRARVPRRPTSVARLRNAVLAAFVALSAIGVLWAIGAPSGHAADVNAAAAPAAAASAVASTRDASPARAADISARRKAEGERRRIARERAAADEGLQARRADCATRFLVNDCVADARREHRRTVDRLRAETAALDDAERTRRAGLRLADIDRKRAAAARADDAASQPVVKAPRHGQGAVQPAAPVLPRHRGDAAHEAHEREAAAAAARASKRARIKEDVQAHRRKIEQRNAADATAGRKSAASLPTPPAASMPPAAAASR